VPTFSLVRTTTYADDAEARIRDLILEGYFQPGQRINEIGLSELLHISRSPIREALKALVGLGLVNLVPGRGAYVTEFDISAVRHLMEVRIALETAAASLAAQRATPEQKSRLEDLLHRIESDVDAPLDAELHGLILTCAANPTLTRHAEEVSTQVQVARTRSGVPRPAERYLEHYRRIVGAIVAGDADGAASAMRVSAAGAGAHMESHARAGSGDGR